MASAPPVVFLVDDDPDFLEMNRLILEARAYIVLCFRDPQEALKRMEKEKPDLVITDLMMRDLDSGFTFSRKIKEDRRFTDIPVVIITAIGSQRGFDLRPRTAEELAAMCADAYFEKPVAPQTLLSKVEELLERRCRECSK